MKAELYKRLFRAIFSEDIPSLKKIAFTIIQEERKLGHNVLADSLEKISITEKPKYTLFERKKSESLICQGFFKTILSRLHGIKHTAEIAAF